MSLQGVKTRRSSKFWTVFWSRISAPRRTCWSLSPTIFHYRGKELSDRSKALDLPSVQSAHLARGEDHSICRILIVSSSPQLLLRKYIFGNKEDQLRRLWGSLSWSFTTLLCFRSLDSWVGGLTCNSSACQLICFCFGIWSKTGSGLKAQDCRPLTRVTLFLPSNSFRLSRLWSLSRTQKSKGPSLLWK